MPFLLFYSVSHDQSSTRCFKEFETKEELAKTIVDYFENYLATVGQSLDEDGETNHEVEYQSDDLFKFMDTSFAEIVCLMREEDQPDLWIPYSFDWVKEAVYLYLRVQYELAINSDDMEVERGCLASC